MDTNGILIGLIVIVGLTALAVEMLARSERRHIAGEQRDARAPPPDPGIDRHTPAWMIGIGQVYGPEQLPTLDHVTGMDALQRSLRDLVGAVLTTRRTDPLTGSTAILLHGPRGAGKSLLVRALAGQYRARLVHVSARLLIPTGGGGPQPLIAALVRHAMMHTPSVLHIDDVEVLTAAEARNTQMHSAAFDLLAELQRRDRRTRCVVIATVTSEAYLPSPAVRRTFDHVIGVERPDRGTRLALLEQILALHGMALDDPENVVELTAGMTPARLINLARRACGRAQLEYGPASTVTAHHFRATLREPIGPRWVDELALPRELKAEVEQLVALLVDPTASVGVLLAGDAGTGKTTLARCLAATAKRHVVTVAADSSGRGGIVSAGTLAARAEQAHAHRPSVLLIDDDRLLRTAVPRPPDTDREGPTHDIVRAEIDRALATPGVAVIATTRRPDRVDRDLAVPHRLEHEIWVPYPDEAARLRLLRTHLRAVGLHGVSLEVLADELIGCTPAALQAIVGEAIRCAEQRSVPADGGPWPTEPTVTPTDFWRARQLVSMPAA